MNWVGATRPSGSALNVGISIGKMASSCTGSDCKQQQYLISRTWVAKDACDNIAIGTQKINVRDTKAPVFNTSPANITVECGTIPSIPTLTATDCDATPTIVLVSDVSTKTTNSTCTDKNYTVTRTWSATDNCGNVSNHTQVITVVSAPDVTIASNGIEACVGATVSLTSAITCQTGTAQTYQWQSSLNGVTYTNIPSATSATYDALALGVTTYFKLIVTQGGCSSVSTPIKVTVAPKPVVDISANNLSICTDGTAIISTSFTGGLGTCTIIWQKSVNNGVTWTTIAGQNGNTLSTGKLDTTTKYQSFIQCTGLGCCSN
jgi:hypothetical protein